MLGDFDLREKVVVVTGGGSGINLAFCQKASALKAKILIADLRLTPEASQYIKDTPEVVFETCDVAKWSDLQKLVPAAVKQFGTVPDVFVAGAGVFEPSWSNFWDDTETERYAAIDINISHPIKLTRIAMRAFLSVRKTGVVLILGSMAGYQGSFSASLYSATKHAITGFTRSMTDLDQLESIKVVTICPGIVATPLWTAHPDQMAEFTYDAAKALSPGQVADAMLEMVQDGSTYPGGTMLEISAGGRRVIPAWNIDPPTVAGGNSANDGPKASIQSDYSRITAKLDKERGSALN